MCAKWFPLILIMFFLIKRLMKFNYRAEQYQTISTFDGFI